jgi:hypothetical protein
MSNRSTCFFDAVGYRRFFPPRAPWALLGLLALTALSGCAGSTNHEPTRMELVLEREQLLLVSDGLRSVQPQVMEELSAARAVWPTIAKGLPRPPSSALPTLVRQAHARTIPLSTPTFMSRVSQLTGPAAGLAGLYETFARLAERGWGLTEAALDSIAKGPPSAARFARSNAQLYIDTIYDAHFNLSLVGKSIVNAYKRLGGVHAFGSKLTAADVAALSKAYSVSAMRLTPHPAASIESP